MSRLCQRRARAASCVFSRGEDSFGAWFKMRPWSLLLAGVAAHTVNESLGYDVEDALPWMGLSLMCNISSVDSTKLLTKRSQSHSTRPTLGACIYAGHFSLKHNEGMGYNTVNSTFFEDLT